MTHDGTSNSGGPQVDEIRGCEGHAEQDPLWTCPSCVAKYGLKMTTPNLKAMMSVGAIRGRWKTGQSGNLAGGPKKESFESLAIRLLEEDLSDPTSGRSMQRRELILRSVYAQAAAGNPAAIKLVLERVWPKKIKHEVDARGSVTVVFDDQDRRELEAADGGGGGDGSGEGHDEG